MRKIMKIVLGLAAFTLALGLNLNYAKNDYGILTNTLMKQVLAQGTNNSGSDNSNSGGYWSNGYWVEDGSNTHGSDTSTDGEDSSFFCETYTSNVQRDYARSKIDCPYRYESCNGNHLCSIQIDKSCHPGFGICFPGTMFVGYDCDGNERDEIDTTILTVCSLK